MRTLRSQPGTRWIPLLAVACAAGLALPRFAAGAPDATQRPNIVVIMADDMGFSDPGCFGGEIHTPNLDRLAAGGLRFTQFYNTAKCETTRAALLSGLYHPEVGVAALRDCMTLGEAMRRAGYHTMMTGKWHLSATPTQRGFDRYFGHLSGATNYFRGDNTFRLDGKPFTVPESGFYTTDADTDYAMRFLEDWRGTDKPFFLYVAYNAPHYPLQAREADVARYRGKYLVGWDELRRQRHQRQLDMGLLAKRWALSPRPDNVQPWDGLSDERKKAEDFKMATYAAMVDVLDANIGRLVDKLKAMGVFENTLIMFLSDNGACPFDRTKRGELPPWDPQSYWCYHTAWANACNTPFRLYKQNQHEGGISSPFIAHWPAVIKTGGQITNQPGHLVDIMATCLDAAGSDYPAEFTGRPIKPLRGLTLLPIFRGEQRQGHDVLYFQFSNNRAVRQGNWKLVSARGEPWELYDLAADRTELHDLSATYGKKAGQLEAMWHAWAKEVGVNARRKSNAGKNRKGQP